MRLTGSLLASAILVINTGAGAQDVESVNDSLFTLPAKLGEQAAALRDSAVEGTDAFDVVESLTTEVGHRLAGSAGDRAAVAWALLKMKRLGFENVRAEPVRVPHWVRGRIAARIVSPHPQPLVAIALGGSVGTPEDGIEAPVLMVENLEALERMDRASVEGKIVYIGDRMERARSGAGYGKAVGKRVNGPAVAAQLGARAVVIRSAGTSDARIAHTGMTRYREGVRRIPAVAVSNADADMIERQVATGREVTLHLRLTSRYLPDARSANVIGEIPGSAAPGAGIVILGGHLDSWDVGTGAVDDGSGVAIVMEAARLIGDLDATPRRTVRVVLYANEEFGLSGASAYVTAHADEIDQHVLAMEADFGDGRVWQLASNVPEGVLPVVHAMQELLDPLDVELGGNDSGGGADIGPLRERGVPVLAPRQDGTTYFDVHHTVSDTLDKVDASSLDQNVAVYATLAWIAANLERDFGRLESAVEVEGGDAEPEDD